MLCVRPHHSPFVSIFCSWYRLTLSDWQRHCISAIHIVSAINQGCTVNSVIVFWYSISCLRHDSELFKTLKTWIWCLWITSRLMEQTLTYTMKIWIFAFSAWALCCVHFPKTSRVHQACAYVTAWIAYKIACIWPNKVLRVKGCKWAWNRPHICEKYKLSEHLLTRSMKYCYLVVSSVGGRRENNLPLKYSNTFKPSRNFKRLVYELVQTRTPKLSSYTSEHQLEANEL